MSLVLLALPSLKIELSAAFCVIGKMIHNWNSSWMSRSGTPVSVSWNCLTCRAQSSSSKLMFRLQVPRAA